MATVDREAVSSIDPRTASWRDIVTAIPDVYGTSSKNHKMVTHLASKAGFGVNMQKGRRRLTVNRRPIGLSVACVRKDAKTVNFFSVRRDEPRLFIMDYVTKGGNRATKSFYLTAKQVNKAMMERQLNGKSIVNIRSGDKLTYDIADLERLGGRQLGRTNVRPSVKGIVGS